MEPFFFNLSQITDASYSYIFNLCDKSRYKLRRFIEQELWPKFIPVCGDPLKEVRNDSIKHLHQRTWEMYLTCLLMSKTSHHLVKPPKEAPDILIEDNFGRLWLEASALETGNKYNEARRLSNHGINDDAILLRLLSAISEKLKQYNKRITKGVVKPSDRYVIAINGGEIKDCDIGIPPHIVKLLYGIGGPGAVFSTDIDIPPTYYLGAKKIVKGKSGKFVKIGQFLYEGLRGISAVLFFPYGIWGFNTLDGRWAITVHNPKAIVPLAPGTFGFGREYWLRKSLGETLELEYFDHGDSSYCPLKQLSL
jgi:hypothetical protein